MKTIAQRILAIANKLAAYDVGGAIAAIKNPFVRELFTTVWHNTSNHDELEVLCDQWLTLPAVLNIRQKQLVFDDVFDYVEQSCNYTEEELAQQALSPYEKTLEQIKNDTGELLSYINHLDQFDPRNEASLGVMVLIDLIQAKGNNNQWNKAAIAAYHDVVVVTMEDPKGIENVTLELIKNLLELAADTHVTTISLDVVIGRVSNVLLRKLLQVVYNDKDARDDSLEEIAYQAQKCPVMCNDAQQLLMYKHIFDLELEALVDTSYFDENSTYEDFCADNDIPRSQAHALYNLLDTTQQSDNPWAKRAFDEFMKTIDNHRDSTTPCLKLIKELLKAQ